MSNQIDFLALFIASAKKELHHQEVQKNIAEEAKRLQDNKARNAKAMADALGRAEL